MTIRVGIVGATGYTALETMLLLLRHPTAQVTVATSRSEVGQAIGAVHPLLAGRMQLTVTAYDPQEIAKQCDVAMCCLPHGASAETVRQLIDAGVRVIDFSADFRLSSLQEYSQYYGIEHPWPERVGQTVYGLPEWFGEQIATADLVANPGCYPTAALLPLGPLLSAGWVEADDIIVDAKSGISGAGRTPKLNTLYCEAAESISAYAIGGHRHQPEMVDLLQRFAQVRPKILFTPHLAPMDRGILATIYVRPTAAAIAAGGLDAVLPLWQSTYGNDGFVHAVAHLPATKHVAHTNHVQMSVRAAGSRWVLVCAIDNLVKGASGAAVQNLNVMFGRPQHDGLN